MVYRRLSGTTSYLATRTKNVLSHRAVEERSITRRADEERHISPYTWPRTSRKSVDIINYLFLMNRYSKT